MTEIELTAADHGATRTATTGDTIAVRLAESPTSGYRWSVERLDGAVLAPAGDEFDADADGRLGGGGRRTLRFTVVGTGRGELALRRSRSWEGEASVAERFGATIDVPR
jgi:inhibitor of cysteine peptidase